MCVCMSVCKHLIISTLSFHKKLLVLNHYYILLNVSSFLIRKHLNYLQSKKTFNILNTFTFHNVISNMLYILHVPNVYFHHLYLIQ